MDLVPTLQLRVDKTAQHREEGAHPIWSQKWSLASNEHRFDSLLRIWRSHCFVLRRVERPDVDRPVVH